MVDTGWNLHIMKVGSNTHVAQSPLIDTTVTAITPVKFVHSRADRKVTKRTFNSGIVCDDAILLDDGTPRIPTEPKLCLFTEETAPLAYCDIHNRDFCASTTSHKLPATNCICEKRYETITHQQSFLKTSTK